MASYTEAIAAICRESKVRRNYYICGTPALLREDVVDTIREVPGIAEEDGHMVYADEITRSRMMAASSSMFVRVAAPTERTAPAIVARWARCGETDAAALLSRVGGDLLVARDAARKMAHLRHALLTFKGVRAPDRALLETLSEPHPREDFVSALTARKKDRALAALEHLDAEQTSKVIGMLAANVEALGRINRVLKREERIAGISERLRMHRTRVEALLPHAASYDPGRVRQCTALLAAADAALADGAGDGLLEMVVAGW